MFTAATVGKDIFSYDGTKVLFQDEAKIFKPSGIPKRHFGVSSASRLEKVYKGDANRFSISAWMRTVRFYPKWHCWLSKSVSLKISCFLLNSRLFSVSDGCE
jgi:hypothetical protein